MIPTILVVQGLGFRVHPCARPGHGSSPQGLGKSVRAAAGEASEIVVAFWRLNLKDLGVLEFPSQNKKHNLLERNQTGKYSERGESAAYSVIFWSAGVQMRVGPSILSDECIFWFLNRE